MKFINISAAERRLLRMQYYKTTRMAQTAYEKALAKAALIQFDAIPAQGVALYSFHIRVYGWGNYYFEVEVRICPSLQFRVVWRHCTGSESSSKMDFTFLDDAIAQALYERADYYDTDAEERAGALAEMAEAA
jgi:hypothetical protein